MNRWAADIYSTDLLERKFIASESDNSNESYFQRLSGRFDAWQEIIEFLYKLQEITGARDRNKDTVVCVHLKIISSIILSAPTVG